MVEAQSIIVSPPPPPVSAVGASLIKQLASCNKTTRDKALRLLITKWLPSQQEISDFDMKKLWKGLFYCVWHADKSLVQAELINGLSSLLLSLHLPLAVHYFSVFLLTIRREWPGIDALRLDKFYLMIRRFLRCFFLLLKNNNWDLDLTSRLIGILEERTFFADDMFQGGNGVNYHIASVFLDELKPFLPVNVGTLDAIFKPLLSVMCKSQDKVLVGKVKSNVFDLLLKTGKNLLERKKKLAAVVSDAEEEDEEIVNLGTITLVLGFSDKFYDLGSSPDCYQGNRKLLYGSHEEFMKLEKDLELSGIEISIPLVKVNDDEAVQDVIPLVTGGETEPIAYDVVPGGGSTTKSSKKKKKKKAANKGSDRSKKENGSENKNKNVKVIIANGESSMNEPTSDGSIITFNESVISNLQMQFEKVAAEIGLEENGGRGITDSIDDDTPKIDVEGTTTIISKKKRKRGRSSMCSGEEVDSGKRCTTTEEKSAKKVRFLIKNNLVWKPQSPLPPQNLRLPPSVTPRGSALKKGIPPGPIREMPPATKTLKQMKKKKKKKGCPGIKTISPGIKRLWKLQTLSI